MDTDTAEDRWAAGGPELVTGGGEGLSLKDLLPHNASEVSCNFCIFRRVVDPVLKASKLTLYGATGLGGDSLTALSERSRPRD